MCAKIAAVLQLQKWIIQLGCESGPLSNWQASFCCWCCCCCLMLWVELGILSKTERRTLRFITLSCNCKHADAKFHQIATATAILKIFWLWNVLLRKKAFCVIFLCMLYVSLSHFHTAVCIHNVWKAFLSCPACDCLLHVGSKSSTWEDWEQFPPALNSAIHLHFVNSFAGLSSGSHGHSCGFFPTCTYQLCTQ